MADQKDELYPMRHSLAHIMASAVTTIWPEAKLGVGPVVDDGFYYDIDIPGVTISTDDFKKIEKEMYKIINHAQPFVKSEKSIDEAIEWAKESNQPYKEELLNDLKREGTTLAAELDQSMMGAPLLQSSAGISGVTQPKSKIADVSFYSNGDFTDLCRGPHVESTDKVGAFKIMRVAGAYWRGKDDNPQMQRLYGVAFTTKEELNNHIKMLEEAKKRDHRKLGKELDLFSFSELVGSGLPLFSPRGTVLKQLLWKYSSQLRSGVGFKEVSIPHITKLALYERSGHADKFGDELFLVKSQETSDELVLKPMNCPHHTQIYASQPRSYRDLPIMYQENTVQYRDEKSGELHGLSRVRSISIDDNHAFVTEEQISKTVSDIIKLAQDMYSVLGMSLKFRLSFKDEEGHYLGDQKLWDMAQAKIKQLAEDNQLDYFIEEGEAAFYGPKIDFIAMDALNREWQLATVQLDFVQPDRFGLTYTDESGKEKTPVMVHSALLGSVERFLSVYIEHTNGHFPYWLAPEQVRILTINDSVNEYVDKITSVLDDLTLIKPVKYNETRYSVDNRNQSLGKKIREARNMRVPVILIIGPKDLESESVSMRLGDNEEQVSLSDLAEKLTSL